MAISKSAVSDAILAGFAAEMDKTTGREQSLQNISGVLAGVITSTIDAAFKGAAIELSNSGGPVTGTITVTITD